MCIKRVKLCNNCTSVAPCVGTPGRTQLVGDGVFWCGRPGHGVNRCSRVDTSFLFLPRGWFVDIRDGQYRAVWLGRSMARSPPANEGWSGREGQPPGSSVSKERLTLAEGGVLPRSPGANRYGGHRWGMCMVFEHKSFFTIGEPSASVSLRDTQTG